MSATFSRNVSATTFYVNVSNAAPQSPFDSWAKAATNIQTAINASSAGDLVLVTNGIYQTGGQLVTGSLTNRVAVTKAIIVQSVNGPAVTVIRGYQLPAVTNGPGAMRCVYLADGATLSGFTLTNGGTYLESGGGVACWFDTSVVSNCVIVGNSSSIGGGGAYLGNYINCVIAGNTSYYSGGGAEGGSFANCLITGNLSTSEGGGLYYPGQVTNCTVAGNHANVDGGGVYAGTLKNCIVFYNTAFYGSNAFNISYFGVSNCCTPDIFNTSCVTNPPAFVNLVGGDFHLSPYSPCINAGRNSFISNCMDLDGKPRIVGGMADIGAYEYQTPVSTISYAWLQQYGLPMVAGIDTTDSDGTGMNNWQKWIAGLNPTNPASVLAMTSAASTNNISGVSVSWQSVNNRTYYLQRGTDLAAQPTFSAIQSNIVGQAGSTSYQDTSATNEGPFFYRVGVQ